MNQSIEIMKDHIVDILIDNEPSIYLFGSVTLGDFKLGWSDIDILCLTKRELSSTETRQLLNLRQELQKRHNNNLYFRSFEGGILSLDEFINEKPSKVVYWGTSGQRITNKFHVDPFSMMELIDNGSLIHGDNIRSHFTYPTKEAIIKAVIEHDQTIRKHALTTGRSLYSAGWFLDIARCIYTLRTGKIIAKTKAGYWALKHNLVPEPEIMEQVIRIRENPNKYKNNQNVMDWLETLGDSVQRFADVLEMELLVVTGVDIN